MASTWQAMRNPSDERLPGVRGVFAVLLGPPIVDGAPRFVHLSWQDENFVLRDFLRGVERKQGDDLPLASLWRTAKVRVPCKGRLRRSVEDHEFWRGELQRLTEGSAAEAGSAPPRPRTAPRPLGLARGLGEVGPGFFEPLPPELVAGFHGEDS